MWFGVCVCVCVIIINVFCFVWCNLTLAPLLVSENCSTLCCAPGLKHIMSCFYVVSLSISSCKQSSHVSGLSSQLQTGTSKQQHINFYIWARCLLWRTQCLASIVRELRILSCSGCEHPVFNTSLTSQHYKHFDATIKWRIFSALPS